MDEGWRTDTGSYRDHSAASGRASVRGRRLRGNRQQLAWVGNKQWRDTDSRWRWRTFDRDSAGGSDGYGRRLGDLLGCGDRRAGADLSMDEGWSARPR